MKRNYWLFFLPAFFLLSCEFEEGTYRYNLGADFINDPTRVIMIDTMTVNTYTTLSDSVITSQGRRLLAGRFENKLGVVTLAESYFRLDPCETIGLHETAVFDSACLVLYPDKYYFGDTAKICQLAVHQLTENITVHGESKYIYNGTRFAYNPFPIATFSYRIRADEPGKSGPDSVLIKLSDDFGKFYYNLLVNEDSLLDEKDMFIHAHKGFVLKPSTPDNSFIMGFHAVADSLNSPRLRIYYHDFTPNDDLYFDYSLEDFTNYEGSNFATGGLIANSYVSCHITNDYSQSVFKNIQSGTAMLPSSETNNVTMIQAGINLRTRIEIPAIDELYSLGIGSVVQAVLYFEPLDGSFRNKSDLPSSLDMYLVDSRNRSYGQMYQVQGSNVAAAVLNFNEDFKNQTYYSFDITHFFRDEYMSKGDPQYSLQMVYPQANIGADVRQLILGSQKHPLNAMKLKVYLTNY